MRKLAIDVEGLLQRVRQLICDWWGHDWNEEPVPFAVIPLTATCGRCGLQVKLVKTVVTVKESSRP